AELALAAELVGAGAELFGPTERLVVAVSVLSGFATGAAGDVSSHDFSFRRTGCAEMSGTAPDASGGRHRVAAPPVDVCVSSRHFDWCFGAEDEGGAEAPPSSSQPPHSPETMSLRPSPLVSRGWLRLLLAVALGRRQQAEQEQEEVEEVEVEV